MKKIIGVVLILGISVVGSMRLSGQSYILTLGDTNTWKITVGNTNFSTYSYYTDGTIAYIDTSWTNADSIEFKNVFGYMLGSVQGFIREDTIKKILYWTNDIIVKSISAHAFILCDFSMQENDSIELYDFSGWGCTLLGYYNLDSIRLVSTQFGQKKFYYLSSNNLISGTIQHPVWVEGVGPLGDLMHPGRTPDENQYGGLSCSFKNADQTYISQHAIDFGNCDINIDVYAPYTSINNFNIYPNPANDKLYIDIKEKAILEILNSQGKIVDFINLTEKTNNLDISELSSGVYVLRITTDIGITIRKLIKQ